MSSVESWFRLHGPYLLGVLRSVCGDRDEADDLFQKVWLIALEKEDRIPPEKAARAWLTGIALKACHASVRKKKRRRLLLKKWGTEFPASTSDQTDTSIPEHFRRRALWIRIGSLPKLQREVLLLRVVEEMTTKEVAETLGRAEGTVKASLHRALGSLKAALGPDFLPQHELRPTG